MNTRTLLPVALLVCSCRNSTSSRAELCGELATSSAVARTLLDHVTLQYASVDHALAKAERWQKKQVTDDEDGTGEFSGAGARARRYLDTAHALCQAVGLVHWQMSEAIDRANETELRAAARHLHDFDCTLRSKADSPDAKQRRAALGEWTVRSGAARDAEAALVAACGTIGASGAPPPLVIPTE